MQTLSIFSTFQRPWRSSKGLCHFWPMTPVLSLKNIFKKSKIQFFCQNIRDTEKMLRKKIIYFKKIYKLGVNHYFIGVISFVYWWKMLIKIKTFGFQKNYTRHEKNIGDRIFHIKKIYKFTADHFFHHHVVFDSIIKNVIKNYYQKMFFKARRALSKLNFLFHLKSKTNLQR